MTKVVVSPSEIDRVAPWALRGLGYSLGVADRAAPILTYTQAIYGQGLQMLRQLASAIELSSELPWKPLVADAAGRYSVDALGKHLFEVGPPAIDLLVASVRDQGHGKVVIRGAIGIASLAALLNMAAREDVACLATYSALDLDFIPNGIEHTGWIAAIPIAGASFFFCSTQKLERSMLEKIFDFFQVDEVGMIERYADHACLEMASRSGFEGDCSGFASLKEVSLDYAVRVKKSLRNGTIANADDLKYVYGLEMQTWAPTSERSRLQTGWGAYV